MALQVSYYCEALSLSPTQFLHERAELPVGFMDEVLEARAYARAKADVDRCFAAKQKAPETRLHELVQEIEFDLVRTRMRSDG